MNVDFAKLMAEIPDVRTKTEAQLKVGPNKIVLKFSYGGPAGSARPNVNWCFAPLKCFF